MPTRLTTSITRANAKAMILLILTALLVHDVRTTLAAPEPSQNNSSPKTLRSMAKVYMAFGNYAKAQPVVEHALNLAQTRNLGDKELALCLIDAAWLYKNQYKLAEAKRTCLLGLELQEKVYGADHPYIAYTLRILGSVYREQGEYTLAFSALDRAMAIAKKHSSPDSANLAAIKVDLAELEEAAERFDQAAEYYSQALPAIIGACGEDHLYTAQVRAKNARLCSKQGKFSQAERLITQALAVQEKTYGPESHLLVPTWLTMAKISQANRQYAKSEKLLAGAMAMVEKDQETENNLTPNVLTTLGELLLTQGKQAQAEKVLLRAISDLQSTAGPNSNSAATALNSLAGLYMRQGKYTKAREQCRKAIEMLEPAFDKDHPTISKLRNTIDQLHQKSPQPIMLAGIE